MIAVTLLEVLLAVLLVRPGETAVIHGFDVVAPPARPVELRAKVEASAVLGVRRDLHGEEVVFSLGDGELGRARTADDGIAGVEWTPPGTGVEALGEHEVRVALADSSTRRAAATVLRVFVRDPERPALVIDLDGTVCKGSGLDVLRKPPDEVRACEGSVEALRTLARSYDLLYVTARDDSLITRSRDWLDHHGFPRGPLLVRDLKLWTLSAERYKKKRLRDLARDFNLFAGVGDRKEDALAYLDAGMLAILVGDEDDVPRGARKLVHWSEVAKLLEP